MIIEEQPRNSQVLASYKPVSSYSFIWGYPPPFLYKCTLIVSCGYMYLRVVPDILIPVVSAECMDSG